jgi:hypothetical protein
VQPEVQPEVQAGERPVVPSGEQLEEKLERHLEVGQTLALLHPLLVGRLMSKLAGKIIYIEFLFSHTKQATI